MSFASEIKKEVSATTFSRKELYAELYAIILLKASFVISNNKLNLVFQTKQNFFARRISSLFTEVFNIKVDITLKTQSTLDKKPIYIIAISDDTQKILKEYKIINNDLLQIEKINEELLIETEEKISFLRGAFLSRGSVNNPETSNYHLEIVCDKLYIAKKLQDILLEVGIEASIIKRPKGHVLYLKRSEHIGDFLRYIGAVNNLFSFEDIRIKKDLNNYVNRMINCDVANEQKVLKTAEAQLKDIKYIKDTRGFLNLSQRLLDAIILRNTYPDDSLSSLSEKSEDTIGKYVSKSGLSHCYNDLRKMAIEIKKK
ncbi:MAG TPA: DNA-binding protein WhiA [Acholeplasmataceae bacterium]|nr:DNA-binding protein WhiA [Acholeplasmataceae bacterium]